MSHQDDLFDLAVRRGITPEELHRGAQSNANSSWFFGIVTGLVFYFVSWMWALLPLALTLWSIYRSISATKLAIRLEEYHDFRRG